MRLRTTALFVSTTLLLGACSAADTLADGIRDVASEAADAIGQAASEAANGGSGGTSTDGGTSPGDAGSANGNGTSTDGGGASNGGGGLSAALGDLNGVGFHGPAMLRGSIARLVIEIDVQQGVSVNQGAVDHLVSTMRQVVDKPGGVTLAGGNSFESSRTEWTSAQLREVAAQNRSQYSGGDTVVVYVLYVDGGFFSNGEQTSAIGVAYNASEIALFPTRWAGLSLLGSDSATERAVLVHEWGHLLGLVNIGYTSEIDHEDPDHPGHSRDQGSAMYYAIETTLIGQVFSGSPPDEFGDADLADLEGIRTGKYRA